MSEGERLTRENFYGSALGRAGDEQLAVAREIEGLDDEVALLRVQVRRTLEASEVDPKALQGGLRLLVQALLARHRLSPQQAEHLGEAVANVLEEFGEALGTIDG